MQKATSDRSSRGNPESVSFFAPFRVSLAGGGTDLPEFYQADRGAVVSLTLDCGIVVHIMRPRMPGYVLQHSKVERVASVDEISHDLVRESIRLSGATSDLHISIQSQLPFGTGLGTSGTLCVALLGALAQVNGDRTDPADLAERAFHIERNVLGLSAGKQDQYAAAFGGLNAIFFDADGTTVSPIGGSGSLQRLAEFESHFLLFHTGGTRAANTVLQGVAKVKRRGVMVQMRELAIELHHALQADALDMSQVGRIVEENWLLKRELDDGVTSPLIDRMHDAALAAGAYGAKLLGAGSEGFVLVVAPPSLHPAIRTALAGQSEIAFRMGWEGARPVSRHD